MDADSPTAPNNAQARPTTAANTAAAGAARHPTAATGAHVAAAIAALQQRHADPANPSPNPSPHAPGPRRPAELAAEPCASPVCTPVAAATLTGHGAASAGGRRHTDAVAAAATVAAAAGACSSLDRGRRREAGGAGDEGDGKVAGATTSASVPDAAEGVAQARRQMQLEAEVAQLQTELSRTQVRCLGGEGASLQSLALCVPLGSSPAEAPSSAALAFPSANPNFHAGRRRACSRRAPAASRRSRTWPRCRSSTGAPLLCVGSRPGCVGDCSRAPRAAQVRDARIPQLAVRFHQRPGGRCGDDHAPPQATLRAPGARAATGADARSPSSVFLFCLCAGAGCSWTGWRRRRASCARRRRGRSRSGRRGPGWRRSSRSYGAPPPPPHRRQVRRCMNGAAVSGAAAAAAQASGAKLHAA